MKKALSFLLGLALCINLSAQTKTISGRVVDKNSEPVIGASVIELGTAGNGTITDLDGKFSLKINAGNNVQVSYIGYKSMIVDVKTGTFFNIVLIEDAQKLDEVVVTGYGSSQTRARSTNSIAKVDNQKLSSGVFSNPAQALSGAVSGLRVVQTSGNPGAIPSITLRGGTNLDGTGSPLIIIDGQIRSSMSDINPENIEDMQVMKDAGATAIYGARANNGVSLLKQNQVNRGLPKLT